VKKLAALLGIDGAVLAIVLNRAVMIIQAPLFIYFLLRYLSPAEQGFWYTFKSLSALVVFAELGFGVIMTQFVSHEFIALRVSNGFVRGSRASRDRLFSLVRYAMCFYMLAVPFAIVILSLAGILVFRKDGNTILAAWLCYSLVGGLNIFTLLMQAVYQGLDKAKEAQRNALAGSVANFVFICGLLYMKAGIWALVLGTFCGLLVMLGLLWRISAPFWMQFWGHRFSLRHGWFREVVSLQWRYAISWIAGYFIGQFMLPLVKYYVGVVEAGQLGMSISMVSAIQVLSGAWVTARIPQLSMMVARGQRAELDALIDRIQRNSMIAFSACVVLLAAALFLLFPLFHWETRVLPPLYIGVLLLGVWANILMANWGFYLRAHKEEPYMLPSLVMSIVLSCVVWAILYYCKSVFYALLASSGLTCVLLVVARKIYIEKRISADVKK